MANKDDQIIQLLTDVRSHIINLEVRLRRVEDQVQTILNDVVTVGNWTREIKDRR
jgi:hypothetical protein